MIRAVLFDVDFTLIYPGPTFQGEGYRSFCASYGITVDPEVFHEAVAEAAPILEGSQESLYNDELFVRYTRRIIEGMGGQGGSLDACAREICAEWAACEHFHMYHEVPDVLRALAEAGLRVGLISNSPRCLRSFQAHFELHGLIGAAVSSAEYGYMKPHPSIFQAVLRLLDVAPPEAVMVGDSVRQDIEGALGAGLRAVLLYRAGKAHPREDDLTSAGVPVVRSLTELPSLVASSDFAPRASADGCGTPSVPPRGSY